jgi:dipeptidyl-peptidase-4
VKRAVAHLFPAFVAFAFIAPTVAPQAPIKTLSVEDIFAHGPLIGTPPRGLTWSPDSKHLTYLDGGELIDLDPGSGKPHVLVSRAKLATLGGAKATEQERDRRDRYKMANYLWSPDSKHLLFDSNGRLWFYDLSNGTGVEIGFTGQAAGEDPKFSPNGETLSFIRNHGLAVVHLHDPGTPTNLIATSPLPAVLNGEVDWVYEEELNTRSNYFWSPDSRNLAFLQSNETAVPEYPITDWIPMHATVDSQRYPQPGDPNPEVRVGVVGSRGGKTAWMKLPVHPGQDYIPRFGWVDPRTLWVEMVSRDQKHREFFFADSTSGQAHSVLKLSDDKFIDDNYDVYVAHGVIVLTNWNDGNNHLYLYSYPENKTDNATAKLERQLTQGDFQVGQVYRVDLDKKLVFFASSEGSPLEQQMWQVSFDGERKQLTAGEGNHDVNLSPSGTSFSDRYSSRMNPPTLQLCDVGAKCNAFWSTRALNAYALRAPEQIEAKAKDGTTLYATLLLPADATSPASVPLIVNPYGGPGPQTVANRWSDSLLFDELLAQRGFAVLHADNRGSGMRGRSFAQAAFHDFGAVQLEDQLTVVDAVLAKYPQLDSKRLGWWGWSWGGTFTLYALTHSDRFSAGVAVAPVTDWRNYDSIYTERYMSTPSEFADGYKEFSVVNSAAQLKGRLLLVHGTGDDNVHIENTVQFVQKLIEAGIPYDLQLYPRKTHSISGPDVRTHLYKRILAHFEENLKPATQAAK